MGSLLNKKTQKRLSGNGYSLEYRLSVASLLWGALSFGGSLPVYAQTSKAAATNQTTEVSPPASPAAPVKAAQKDEPTGPDPSAAPSVQSTQPPPSAAKANATETDDLVLTAEYTRILFIDKERNYVIFNKGGLSGVVEGTKICILGEQRRKVFCSKIEAAIDSLSAYHVPAETLRQVPENSIGRAYVLKDRVIFKEPDEDDTNAYVDDGVKKFDTNPFFVTTTGIFVKLSKNEKEETEKRSQMAGGGFSLAYLLTPKSPVSCRNVYFTSPQDAAIGDTESVWSSQDKVASSPSGLMLSYIGTRRYGFNPVYSAYFRFFSWRRNQQNFLPSDDQSYVQTSQLFYSTGLSLGLSRQVGVWRSLRFRPIAGLALERSIVTYEADAFGGTTQGNATLANFTSQIYLLATHLEMEALYVHDYVDIVLSLGSDIPMVSMTRATGNPAMPAAQGVTYAAGADNNLASHIDHKTTGASIQMLLGVRYAF